MAVTPEAREGGERRVAERDKAQSAAPTKSKTDRLTLGTIAEFWHGGRIFKPPPLKLGVGFKNEKNDGRL